MCCPKCGSEEWKLARLVYDEGLNYINTSTKGGGVGVGTGGIGVGVGGGKTNGTSQSALSMQAKPPDNVSFGEKCLCYAVASGVCCIIYLWLFERFGVPFWTLLGFFAISAALAKLTWNSSKAAIHRATKKYENTRVCMRCGCFYDTIDYNNNISENTPTSVTTYPLTLSQHFTHKQFSPPHKKHHTSFCEYIDENGVNCKRITVEKSKYCYMHVTRCKYIKENGKQCKSNAVDGNDYCTWHINQK